MIVGHMWVTDTSCELGEPTFYVEFYNKEHIFNGYELNPWSIEFNYKMQISRDDNERLLTLEEAHAILKSSIICRLASQISRVDKAPVVIMRQ